MKRRRRAIAHGVATVVSAAVLLGASVQYATAAGAQVAAAGSGGAGVPATGALPSTPGSSALGPWRSFLKPTPAQSTGNSLHQVLVVLGSTTQVTGPALGRQPNLQVRAPLTSDAAVNTALRRAHAV